MASFTCFAKVGHIALEFSNNNNSNGEEELKLYFYYSVCTYEQQFRFFSWTPKIAACKKLMSTSQVVRFKEH